MTRPPPNDLPEWVRDVERRINHLERRGVRVFTGSGGGGSSGPVDHNIPPGGKRIIGDPAGIHSELESRADGGVNLNVRDGSGALLNTFVLNAAGTSQYDKALLVHDGFVLRDGFGGPIVAEQAPSGAHTLTLGQDPVDALDAATKQYVDQHSGGGGVALTPDYLWLGQRNTQPIPNNPNPHPTVTFNDIPIDQAGASVTRNYQHGAKVLRSGLYVIEAQAAYSVPSSASSFRIITSLVMMDQFGKTGTMLASVRGFHPGGMDTPAITSSPLQVTKWLTAGDAVGMTVFQQGASSVPVYADNNQFYLRVTRIDQGAGLGTGTGFVNDYSAGRVDISKGGTDWADVSPAREISLVNPWENDALVQVGVAGYLYMVSPVHTAYLGTNSVGTATTLRQTGWRQQNNGTSGTWYTAVQFHDFYRLPAGATGRWQMKGHTSSNGESYMQYIHFSAAALRPMS